MENIEKLEFLLLPAEDFAYSHIDDTDCTLVNIYSVGDRSGLFMSGHSDIIAAAIAAAIISDNKFTEILNAAYKMAEQSMAIKYKPIKNNAS